MAQTPHTEFDVVVIGAGPPGENVADYARRGGLSVVMVEAELVGGECSFWACMPSKALLRPVDALSAARAVSGSAQAATGALDVGAVLARRDAFTHDWDDTSQVDWLDSVGVPLVRGAGRLTGVRQVEVSRPESDPVVLSARHAVVVATGTSARMPPVDGLADVGAWTSREATSAQRVPGRLLVLGGGVVGVEMATAYAGFGARVTVLQRGDRLLPGTEPEAGELIAQALRAQGVDVRLGAEVQTAARRADGTVVIGLAGGEELEGDELLVATGRAPRTDDLGLAAVGLAPGSYLATDDAMQVTGVDGRWLYAVGDVTGRVLLTHQGKYQARACGQVIAARAAEEPAAEHPLAWSRFAATADHDAVPQVVFSDPQVASVGLLEQTARDRGLPVRTAEYDLAAVAGASLLSDSYAGWAKLVVDGERRVVLGATFVGPEVAELVHAATIAIVGEVPLDRLWHAVPAYPTVSEIWLRLLDQLDR